ncbi:MAG: IclR family transcriptional regulator [Variibacter sp.]|nr:IclR family transcriptional regulator [Variibacter sp.]
MSVQPIEERRVYGARIRGGRIGRGVEDHDRSTVKSLRKAMAVLKAVATAERPLTIAELAARTGIARPTAYRLVQTLAGEGHLVQSPIDGRLSIGFSVLPLAASLLDRNRLRLEALPHLHALAQQTGERVNLGILHREQVLYLAGVEKPSLPTIYTRFGKTVPAHCSSLGKAILAFMRESEVMAILEARPLVALTPNTITTVPRFLEELEETRRRGYAVDNAEAAAGSYCIGAAIFDAANEPVGAISLSGRALEPLLAHVDTLRHTAEVISHVL